LTRINTSGGRVRETHGEESSGDKAEGPRNVSVLDC